MPTITPQPRIGMDISRALRAELNLCYTCGSCAAECPVNRATSRLSPVKCVRMAGFGMMDSLLRSPEIWYCLACSRCSNICPMTVKPGVLLSFFRNEAVRRHYAGKDTPARVRELQKKLHRVRWHAAALLRAGKETGDIPAEWDRLSATPVPAPLDGGPPLEYPSRDAARFRRSLRGYLDRPTNLNSCLTCSECKNSCPVCQECSVFDPLLIFREIALGLREEVLGSISLWLCIGCRSCTSACGQLVRGHFVLHRAQELAVEQGFVDGLFLEKWREIQHRIYPEYIRRVDALLAENVEMGLGDLPDRDFNMGEPGYEIIHKKPIWGPADVGHVPSLQ